jgi:outer membrane protein assembly factor BamB
MKHATFASLLLLTIMLTCMLQVYNTVDCLSVESHQKWVTPTDETIFRLIATDNFVYLTTGDSEGVPNAFLCLDAQTGNQVWNYTDSSLDFTMVNGSIYMSKATFLPSSLNFTHHLLCFNAANGSVLWKNELNDYVSKPIVDGDSVYVRAGNAVYRFDAFTGEKKWDYIVPVDTLFWSLDVQNGFVCATSRTEKENQTGANSIHMLNAATGQKIWIQEMWSYNYPLGYPTNLSMYNGTVIVSYKVNREKSDASGSISALDPQNGAILWKYTPAGFVGGFTFANGVVYCTGSAGSVSAINASNGYEIWNYKNGPQFGSVFLVDNQLFVGSATGVYCFNSENGGKIWSYQARDYSTKPNSLITVSDFSPVCPLLAEGVVYFGWNGPQWWAEKTEHYFYSLSVTTGALVWYEPLSYSIMVPPVMANNTIFIGGSNVTHDSPDHSQNGAQLAYSVKTAYVSSVFDSTGWVLLVGSIIADALAVFTIYKLRKRM